MDKAWREEGPKKADYLVFRNHPSVLKSNHSIKADVYFSKLYLDEQGAPGKIQTQKEGLRTALQSSTWGQWWMKVWT